MVRNEYFDFGTRLPLCSDVLYEENGLLAVLGVQYL